MLDYAPRVCVCLSASPPCRLPKGTLWEVRGLFSHIHAAPYTAAVGWLLADPYEAICRAP